MNSAAPRAGAWPRQTVARGESGPGRAILIALALLTTVALLVLPLVVIFSEALAKGPAAYFLALVDPETVSAIQLTLLTALVSVPLNLAFGIAAAWLLAKYEFWGKSVLITLLDLPISVSPVVAGLVFILLFGANGWIGPWLSLHDIKIVFSPPGIIVATTFVTLPMVAREVLAVMQAQGNDEEEAALTLGASGWQILFGVTLPKVRWGLFYGVILCNARAMGEFGAVSVVSGHIRGLTTTVPLQVEILYNEYHFVAAFAVASMLALLALSTLLAKGLLELADRRRGHPEASELASASSPTHQTIG